MRYIIEVAFLVAGAFGLDVAGLLALVADLLAGGRALGAVPGKVTGLATVVALASVHAVACARERKSVSFIDAENQEA